MLHIAGAGMKSLTEIRSTLQSALGSEALFSLLNVRVMLRTGVDLRTFSDGENEKPEVVAKVIEALKALGYSPESLMTVAKRKSQT